MSPRDFLAAAIYEDMERGLSVEDGERNAFIRYNAALDRDSPAKRWFMSANGCTASTEAWAAWRAPVYRALRIDPGDPCACYACVPFRAYKNEDEEWRVFAAWPAIRMLSPPGVKGWLGDDWLGIETVVEWDPRTDTAIVVGDPDSQLVGNLNEDGIEGGVELHASPRLFFQNWARRRAQYLAMRQTTSSHWTVAPEERDEVPGALLVGRLDDVRLAPSTLPMSIECHGIDPKALNRAILRAARIPRAHAGASVRRVA